MGRFSWLCGVSALWMTLAPPAVAQQPGTFEVGAFGQYTWFDNSLSLDDAPGIGGLLGMYFSQNRAVEGEVAYSSTSGASYVPIRARLLFSPHLGQRLAILLGAGYVHSDYGGSNPADDGVTGLVGLRYDLGSRPGFGIRLAYVGDYIPSPQNSSTSNYNGAIQAGLSLLFPRGPKDPDHDGVTDPTDQCPNTPPGDVIDADGCSLPKDADHDGVIDPLDQCPDTPAGARVDSAGCPIVVDGDHDGVPDPSDFCPNTPAGQVVDRFGCTPDRDGDGVQDSQDQCPDTPGGVAVDSRGCEIVPVFHPGTTALVLEGVNFETAKATLLETSREILDKVAASLIANPDVRVEVSGYTDSRGTLAFNMKLSQARAEAVVAYLVDHGVAPQNLVAKGYGPADPVASNATAEGRAQNRRVELHKLD